VDDVPLRPDRQLLSALIALHDTIAEEQLSGDGHLAMALCRPGRPQVTEDDDAWAEALHRDLDDGIDSTWSLHLAAAGTVTPLVEPPPLAFRRRG
jgi:hypothetical protein